MRGWRISGGIAGAESRDLRGYSADILVMGDDWAGKFIASRIFVRWSISPHAVGVDEGIIEVIRGGNGLNI